MAVTIKSLSRKVEQEDAQLVVDLVVQGTVIRCHSRDSWGSGQWALTRWDEKAGRWDHFSPNYLGIKEALHDALRKADRMLR